MGISIRLYLLVSYYYESVHLLCSLRPTSTCEFYVAIIVGSMPGFASFFSGKMPGVSLLASMNSVLLKSRNGALGNKIGLSSGESIIPSGPRRDKGYLEVQDTRHLGESVRTEIRAEGAPSRSEEGVVHKTVAFHQSTT